MPGPRIVRMPAATHQNYATASQAVRARVPKQTTHHDRPPTDHDNPAETSPQQNHLQPPNHHQPLPKRDKLTEADHRRRRKTDLIAAITSIEIAAPEARSATIGTSRSAASEKTTDAQQVTTASGSTNTVNPHSANAPTTTTTPAPTPTTHQH